MPPLCFSPSLHKWEMTALLSKVLIQTKDGKYSLYLLNGMDTGRWQSWCDATKWFAGLLPNKKKTLVELFVMHLTQTLGFLSFSIFQWRIWPIWKINRAHWLGWQLWRKTNQARSCLLWWTSVTCSPSQPWVAAHRAWCSPRALCGLAADDSGMCAAEPDTVGLHITIYQFCQACFCLVTSSMFYAFLKPNWSSCFVLLQHI